jgi:hypothetical protein
MLLCPRCLGDALKADEEGPLEVQELLEVREKVVNSVTTECARERSGIFLSTCVRIWLRK